MQKMCARRRSLSRPAHDARQEAVKMEMLSLFIVRFRRTSEGSRGVLWEKGINVPGRWSNDRQLLGMYLHVYKQTGKKAGCGQQSKNIFTGRFETVMFG